MEQWTGEVGDHPKIDQNWGFGAPKF